PGVPAQHLASVELFGAWRATILRIREAVRLWDLIEDVDEERLKEVIKWEGGGLVNYYPPPEFGRDERRWRDLPEKVRRHFIGQDILGRAPAAADTLRSSIKPGDVLRPAMLVVNDLINGYLGNVGPQLIYDPASKRSVVQERPY